MKELGQFSGRPGRTSSSCDSGPFQVYKAAFPAASVHSFLAYCFRKLTTCGFPANSLAMICREYWMSLLLPLGNVVRLSFNNEIILLRCFSQGGRGVLAAVSHQSKCSLVRSAENSGGLLCYLSYKEPGECCAGGKEPALKGMDPM